MKAEDKANLKRTTKQTVKKMLAAVKQATKDVEALIAEHVRQNPYGWMDAGRESTYTAIDAHFKSLRKSLDGAIGGLVRASASTGSLLAEAQSKGAVVRFSEEHLQAYLERVTPKNAPSLAAVYTASMSASVKAALRETAINVFTQGAAAGLTMHEQARQFQSEWALRAKDRNPYRFVDKRGRAWENARYIQMLTRTTAQRVETAAFCDSMLASGFPIARISNDSGNDCGICAQWEGRLIDLSAGHQLGSGTYTLQEAREAGLFHPNCTHRLEYVSVSEIPDALWEKIKDKIGKPGAFGKPGEAVKPDLPNKKQTQQHIKQVETAASNTQRDIKPNKAYIGDQKELTNQKAIDVADQNKERLIKELERGTMPRKHEYAAWVAEFSSRDAAWLSKAVYMKARNGAFHRFEEGKNKIHIDGAENTITKIHGGSRNTFYHESGHAILDAISKKDPRIFDKIRTLMDAHQAGVIKNIETRQNVKLLPNIDANMTKNYEIFGYKGPPSFKIVDLRKRFDGDDGRAMSCADAACALTKGDLSSGHKKTYWTGGRGINYRTAHEFVANLTSARYNKNENFMELFHPLAQEVQDLLDSYEP